MAFDPEAIKANHTLSEYIGRYVTLKRAGGEYVGLSPFKKERTPSFTVVDHKGFWHDFAADLHGDLIDFVCRYHGVSFTEACEILGGERLAPNTAPTQKPSRKPDPELPLAEVPDSHEGFEPGKTIRAWSLRREPEPGWVNFHPDRISPYHAPDGELLGYIIRTEYEGRKKSFSPIRPAVIDGEVRWCAVAFPKLRPLYNAHQLPDDVWVAEGEKAADALGELLSTVATTWQGGSNAVHHTDWSPLAGKKVTIWADADAGGQKAAIAVAHKAHAAGARLIKIIPWDETKDEGWDAADAEHEGWSGLDVMEWAGPRAQVFDPTTAPDVESETSEESDPDAAEPAFDAQAYSGQLPPPRPWAYGTMLLHRTVTAIAAPPGTGKSTWAIQLAIAFSQHLPFGDFKPKRTGPVWLWNNEDDSDELDRRTAAACIAMDIDPARLAGRFFLNSGADRQLIVAREVPGAGLVATPDVARVIEVIKQRGIKLLIVDPFSETFEVESENSNDIMKKVARLYRDIAQACDCSVLIIAHTPKGTNGDKNAGSLDSIRGGGAIGGVVRSAWTMFEMTDADGEEYGVDEDRRHHYIRLDDAKSNMSLKSGRPSWWRREGVSIDNSEGDYPADTVGTLMPFTFQKAEERRTDYSGHVKKIAAEIVRVCLARGYTTLESAASLDRIASSLNEEEIGLKNSKIKRLITGEMSTLHVHGHHLIVVTETPKPSGTVRRVHVEEN